MAVHVVLAAVPNERQRRRSRAGRHGAVDDDIFMPPVTQCAGGRGDPVSDCSRVCFHAGSEDVQTGASVRRLASLGIHMAACTALAACAGPVCTRGLLCNVNTRSQPVEMVVRGCCATDCHGATACGNADLHCLG